MAKWYDDYLKSVHWERTRLTRLLASRIDEEFGVIQCDDPHCQMWFPLGLLEVHHNTYERLGREWLTDLDVLCSSCHGVRHGHDPAYWWQELKAGKCMLVNMESVKYLKRIKHIGEVVVNCLEHHHGAIPHPLPA